MRRLFPVTDMTTDGAGSALADSADREWDLLELAEVYAYPEGPGGWVRANMVSSLDGAAEHGGRSQPLSGAADMRIFGTLRALADVVVVGASTVRQEAYRPAKERAVFAPLRAAAGQRKAAAIAVVTSGMDLDFTLPLFTEPLAPTLVLTAEEDPSAGSGRSGRPSRPSRSDKLAEARDAGVEVVMAGERGVVDPRLVVEALVRRGLHRILTEGGPSLLGQFVTAGQVDELCLTLSPHLTAGEAVRVAHGTTMEVPERFALASVLEEAGFLFTRYRRI